MSVTAALPARHDNGTADAGWLVSGSPDLIYRRTPYRIEERLRANGASVRPAVGTPHCWSCPRILRQPATALRMPDRATYACIPCAILMGSLVPFAWTCTVAPEAQHA